MRTQEVKRFLDWYAGLEPADQQQVLACLAKGHAAEAFARIVEGRLGPRSSCHRCASTRVVRNGHADGLQRYKCRHCGVSFNALSATPMARLRLRDKWAQYGALLEQGQSVRKCAAELDVHRTTAFRWRHRFLSLPCKRKPQALVGIVEANETYMLHSFKGQPRELLRNELLARHRGGKARTRGITHDHVPILMVRNRAGQTSDFVLEATTKAQFCKALQSSVAADAVLCTDGSNTLAAVARELHLEHQAMNVLRGQRVRGAWHIQNVNAYHGRFKMWLERFKGVATSYLPNYLGWFRALDRNAQPGEVAQDFLSLAVGA
jgi:transposase-like protein